jgi:CubicO group peptidase (beta-lactamase class C family)
MLKVRNVFVKYLIKMNVMMNANRTTIFLIIISMIFISCKDSPTESNSLSFYEWPTSTPEEQDLNSVQLDLAFQEAEKRPHIYSIVVIRNGKLVAEKYYHSYSKSSSFNIRSVSKSFLSAMTGIAIRDGIIEGLNEKVLDYYPEYVTQDLDNRKFNIIVEHLLTMKGGIESEHNNYITLYNSSNWIKETIEFPLLYNPGERFSYNTFLTHILSGIITKASKMTTLEFGQKYLCDPMKINIQDWQQGPQGIYFGGNSMYFTTRDIARLGYLYLNNGMIDSNQIVPEEWVAKSLTNHRPSPGGNWGELKNIGYGYLWWLGEMKGYKAFMAIGYGGQFVINFPALNMIVATNSDAYINTWEEADQNERSVLDVVANYILPAVTE